MFFETLIHNVPKLGQAKLIVTDFDESITKAAEFWFKEAFLGKCQFHARNKTRLWLNANMKEISEEEKQAILV
jgi:hypothetical protein